MATALFRDIPLNSQAFKAFLKKIQLARFKRNEIIYRPGDTQSEVFLVREGEIHIKSGSDGDGRLLSVQGRGSLFGEVSYLSGEPHSTTTIAILDSAVYVIPGDALIKLMQDEPSVGGALATILSRRLYDNLKTDRESPARIYTLIYPENPARGKLIARHLARALSSENPAPIILLCMNPGRDEPQRKQIEIKKLLDRWNRLSIGEIRTMLQEDSEPFDIINAEDLFQEWKSWERTVDHLPNILGLLKKYYSVILVDSKPDPDNLLLQKVVTQSDRIIFIRSMNEPNRDENRDPWMRVIHHCRQHQEGLLDRAITVTDEPHARGIRISDIHRLDTFIKESSIIYKTHYRLKSISPDSLSEDYDPILKRNIERLARYLSGTSRGLSLGGGGARSMAHIGVLQILEQEDIEFDAISGSSMGAIIGAAYAMGYSADEIAEQIRKRIPNSSYILDKNLPALSFFRGIKIRNLLADFFKDTTFEELQIPFYCNGSDLRSGKSIVFQKGLLVPALQASLSIPGFFPPVQWEDYTIVDGSVLNNIPGDILRKRGINRIIGINVTPNIDPTATEMGLTKSRGFVKGVYDYLSLPPILKIVTRSIAIQGLALQSHTTRDLDFVLHPNLEGFELFEFHHLDKIIDRGRQSAIVNMASIREALTRKKFSVDL